MGKTYVNIRLPLSFDQLVDAVKQLPDKQKIRLAQIIEEETQQSSMDDKIYTHLASEKTLAKDWLSPEEDEAWKDL